MIRIWTMAATALLATSLEAQAAPRKADANADPAREICKSRPVVGSRLKKVRTCMTAQEWEDLELQEELGLGRQQINGEKGCSFEYQGSACGIARGGKDTPW